MQIVNYLSAAAIPIIILIIIYYGIKEKQKAHAAWHGLFRHLYLSSNAFLFTLENLNL